MFPSRPYLIGTDRHCYFKGALIWLYIISVLFLWSKYKYILICWNFWWVFKNKHYLGDLFISHKSHSQSKEQEFHILILIPNGPWIATLHSPQHKVDAMLTSNDLVKKSCTNEFNDFYTIIKGGQESRKDTVSVSLLFVSKVEN